MLIRLIFVYTIYTLQVLKFNKFSWTDVYYFHCLKNSQLLSPIIGTNPDTQELYIIQFLNFFIKITVAFAYLHLNINAYWPIKRHIKILMNNIPFHYNNIIKITVLLYKGLLINHEHMSRYSGIIHYEVPFLLYIANYSWYFVYFFFYFSLLWLDFSKLWEKFPVSICYTTFFHTNNIILVCKSVHKNDIPFNNQVQSANYRRNNFKNLYYKRVIFFC